MTLDSSCYPAGISYLVAFGFGIAVTVLGSWLLEYQRAVYRDGGAFQRAVVNAAPRWTPVVTGIAILLSSSTWLAGWADTCLPTTPWIAAGSATAGVGVALAATAAGRLIFGRVRGGITRPLADTDEEGDELPTTPAAAPKREPNLPPERRRVIVEYAVTYGVAVVIIFIGIGFLWS